MRLANVAELRSVILHRQLLAPRQLSEFFRHKSFYIRLPACLISPTVLLTHRAAPAAAAAADDDDDGECG